MTDARGARPLRYRIDPSVRTVAGGRALLGGDPLRLLRLTPAGMRAVERWRREGISIDEGTPPGTRALVERLVDVAMAHPCAAASRDEVASRVHVVVPVHGRPEPLRRCLAALARSGVRDVVVCDDASADGDELRRVTEDAGARYVRRETNGGPSAARMSGWRFLVTSGRVDPEGADDLVAFVDSDVEVRVGWLAPLVGLFHDPRVGLAAPRVRHLAAETARPTVVDRYEEVDSPLDLGRRRAPIVPGTRVAYVPSAALVVRAAAFARCGGFDERLQVGEDVDLLWRLHDDGWRCRYEPASEVVHVGRSGLAAMLARRVDYGTSAAPLDERHPGALPPLRANAWSLGIAAALATGHPVAAAVGWAWTIRTMRRRLAEVDPTGRLAAELTARGHLGAVRQLGRAAIRPWFPLAIAAAAGSRRLRRAILVGALFEPTARWASERPRLDPVRFVGLRLLDDLAYAVGVWRGAVSSRRFGALVPEIATSPGEVTRTRLHRSAAGHR